MPSNMLRSQRREGGGHHLKVLVGLPRRGHNVALPLLEVPHDLEA